MKHESIHLLEGPVARLVGCMVLTFSLSACGGGRNALVVLLTASPSTLNFGDVQVGQTSSQAITLTNPSGSTVVVSAPSLSGSGFSVKGLSFPLTLAAAQNASLTVVFAPTAVGTFSGNISLTANAGNSNATVTVSLSGTAPHLVTLSWSASTSVVSGYNIYRASVSTPPPSSCPTPSVPSYQKLNSSRVAAAPFTDNSVQGGKSYCYAATAVDANGVESVFSNAVPATVP